MTLRIQHFLAIALAPAILGLAWQSDVAAAGPITLSESAFDFGGHPLGATATHHLTLTNAGGSPATLSSRTTNNPGEFFVSNDTCFTAAQLAARASCGFHANF